MTANFNIEKVLVAPLDWGLGHATRCIPIIRALQKRGCRIWLAAEGKQAILLKQEFPELEILPLEGYRVRYGQNRWTFPFLLLKQIPRILRMIKQEGLWLDEQLKQHHFDLVISDNRYGLSSQKTHCIFITHQLLIKAKVSWLEALLQKINYRYIQRFAACWVPDTENEPSLAGMLSHPPKLPAIPVRYLGLLSRFQFASVPEKYKYCMLLSGPEPQRSLMETALISAFAKLKVSCLLVRGKPGEPEMSGVPEHIKVIAHLPGNELASVLLQSEYIICRSGYTSIMEILTLRRKALLIPTPGQTEQEYLGKRLMEQGFCYSFPQNEIPSLKHHLQTAGSFDYRLTDFPLFTDNTLTDLFNDGTQLPPLANP
ncbi:MAG: glycosyl transferase family 28 [Bacteroidota bacterium]|nr:glycosyl transferase family 28 [Bacteroidota bacterium]